MEISITTNLNSNVDGKDKKRPFVIPEKYNKNIKEDDIRSMNTDILEKNNTESYKANIIWCMNCRHGGHVDHMQEWFEELTVCPNSNCSCICLENNLNLI